MKILHILNDGPSTLSGQIISVQAEEHDVITVDLSEKELKYEAVVDKIFAADRVISW